LIAFEGDLKRSVQPFPGFQRGQEAHRHGGGQRLPILPKARKDQQADVRELSRESPDER